MIELVQGKYEKVKEYTDDKFEFDYFEFEFGYVPVSQAFKELNRFIWESKHQMTRFKNNYFGAVLVDISAWNNEFTNEYFNAFMYYLKDMHYTKMIFMVNDMCSKQLKTSLERFFDITEKRLELDIKKTSVRTIGFAMEEKENDYVRS